MKKPTIVWNQSALKQKRQNINRAQVFVDSECLRRMVEFTPARNNNLYKSATQGTKIGSGHIYYKSPAARYLYYGKLMVSSLTGSAYASKGEKKVLTDIDLQYSKARHPNATSFWFEVMKKKYLPAILSGAQKIIKGGG